MLDLIFKNDHSLVHFLHWMEPHRIDLLCTKISDEMDGVKKLLGGTLSSITPESLRAWDINMFIGSMVNKRALITGCMLQIAAQTDHAKQKHKIKSCSTVRKPCLMQSIY